MVETIYIDLLRLEGRINTPKNEKDERETWHQCLRNHVKRNMKPHLQVKKKENLS